MNVKRDEINEMEIMMILCLTWPYLKIEFGRTGQLMMRIFRDFYNIYVPASASTTTMPKSTADDLWKHNFLCLFDEMKLTDN